MAEPAAGTSRDPAATPPTRRSWDAAIGLIASYAPEYAGSSRWSLGLKPGGWVRWGRLSIASRSAFVVRSSDAGAGSGLRVDLSPPGQKLRAGLSLRQDSGRKESDSADLRGLGDVRATVRARLSASYPFDGGLRAGAALTADALGRGGGEVLELTLGRGFPLAPGLNGSLSGVVALGSQRYMQAYYGITEEQSARSGYTVFTPGAGARDVSLSFGMRKELAARWALFGGVSASRLVGKAAASPITRERNSWSVSAGLAYRF